MLPPTEKKRIAELFLQEIWPDIEEVIDRGILRGLKTKTADPAEVIATYSGIDKVKTALRQFTTPDRD